MVATPLIARAKLSVPVNGILVPIKAAAESLRRFCTPAFFHHEGQSIFEMSKVGSAFLVRYRGATRPEQFTVTLIEPDGTRVGLSPNVVSKVRMEHAEHSNLEDVLLLEYENTRGARNLRRLFLELDLARTLETVDPASVKAIFAVGYPTAFGDVIIKRDEESNVTGMDMELRWVKLYLVPDGPALLDAENRRAMVQDPNYDQETIDPDGMSGAPVFFVWLDQSFQAHLVVRCQRKIPTAVVTCPLRHRMLAVASVRVDPLGFVGMITHGRDRRYMIYDGALLRQVVGRYMDEGRS